MEIRQPKGVDIGMYPLRYSADGSIIVVGGTPTLAIDAVTGKTRCAVSEPLRPTTHPNTQGLTAGIGWQMGELPRVVVWNSATCEIRSTLNPNM
jgi:hypothetical protein